MSLYRRRRRSTLTHPMLRPAFTALASIAASCVVAACAPSGPHGAPAPAPRRSEAPTAATSPLYSYETVKLADGLYAFVVADPHAALVSSNTLLVVGDDGALVVDTGHFPSLARRMIGDIRKLTEQPVRYVVSSHWHPDHVFGNAAYRDAYPGVVFMAHDETRRLELKKDPAQVVSQHDTAKTMQRIEHALATGELKPGRPVAARERIALTQTLPQLRDTLGDAEVELVPATETFAGESLTVYLGRREVRVLHFGRGNTAGDAMVYVPDANVLATGDVVVAPVPYGHGSYPDEWQVVLQKIVTLHPSILLPGHGSLQRDLTYVEGLSDLLSSLRAQVATCAAGGLSLEDTTKKVDLSRFRSALSAGDSLKELEFDLDFAAVAVPRAYEEAHGKISDE